MLMCTRPLVVFWWLRKNYWSYRNNSYIFGILTKFYLRKVTSYFTCRAIRGLIFSKLPLIGWSATINDLKRPVIFYALRRSVTCQGFSYSLNNLRNYLFSFPKNDVLEFSWMGWYGVYEVIRSQRWVDGQKCLLWVYLSKSNLGVNWLRSKIWSKVEQLTELEFS